MSTVGQREIKTQENVIQYFKDDLKYDYLGHWKSREGNSNVEEGLLTNWLKRQEYSDYVIKQVLRKLDADRAVSGAKTLYDANQAVYGRLRYGVPVRPAVGAQHINVKLIDWENIENNDFAMAQEVTIIGENGKRPDIVL